MHLSIDSLNFSGRVTAKGNSVYIDCGKDIIHTNDNISINCTCTPEECTFGTMKDIVSSDAPEDIYISPVGCFGIIRRKRERNIKINSRLEEVLLSVSSQMTPEEIEKRSRVQKRGKFSEGSSVDDKKTNTQISIFDNN